MAPRPELAERVCELVGEAAEMVAPGTGWPSHIRLTTESGTHEVSAHVGVVGSMSRGPDERRFQNPSQGTPVRALPGTSPILIGVSDEFTEPVLVVPSNNRLGRQTRFTVRFPVQLISLAARSGWAGHVSTAGERFLAFHPALLPSVFELNAEHLFVNASDVRTGLAGSGVLEDNSDAAQERARRVTSSLVRDSRFSRSVRDAYENRCAMCGLGFGLVAGAHIMPASLPGSPDIVENGLGLCENHHRAFDRHLIWIDPGNFTIHLHPDLRDKAESDSDLAFIDQTRDSLALPHDPLDAPSRQMLAERYEAFESAYSWASAL